MLLLVGVVESGFTIEEGESNVIETVEESEVTYDVHTGQVLCVQANEQQDSMAVQEIIEVSINRMPLRAGKRFPLVCKI